MDALWDVHGKTQAGWRTHSQAHRDKMRARCIDSYWIMDNTHTHVLPRGLEAQRVADIWRFST